jgi:L-threonylcarbamoyladenylate synthase
MERQTYPPCVVLRPDAAGLRLGGELLRAGRLVAFPTETVYGLGANALDEAAARRIFEAKGRPTSDPLIVHVVSMEDAEPLIDVDGPGREVFCLLAAAFWPGPLTLVVRAAACIPPLITAGTGMVGIRSPSHPIARLLLQEARVPVAAPSANLFGHVSPTRCEHVVADLGDRGIHVVDGDSPEHLQHTCVHGIESTVAKIDIGKKVVFLLRQGAITRSHIVNILQSKGYGDWSVELVVRSVAMVSTSGTGPSAHGPPPTPTDAAAAGGGNEGELAPGQAVTHYAPNIPCIIASSIECEIADSSKYSDLSIDDDNLFTLQKLKKTVVIDYGGKLGSIKEHVLAYRDISPDGDASAGAREIFLSLRWAELVPGAGYVILANIAPSEGTAGAADFLDGVGPGLADRMQRAASGRRVDIKCFI